jgi:hypothetical protein
LLLGSISEVRFDSGTTQSSDIGRRARFVAGVGVLLALQLSACAIVEEARPDGTRQRSIVFAAPVVVPSAAANQSSVVRATGLGLEMSSGTATLGWFNKSIIALDPSCRVVLVGNTEEQLRNFAELTNAKSGVCSDSAISGETR